MKVHIPETMIANHCLDRAQALINAQGIVSSCSDESLCVDGQRLGHDLFWSIDDQAVVIVIRPHLKAGEYGHVDSRRVHSDQRLLHTQRGIDRDVAVNWYLSTPGRVDNPVLDVTLEGCSDHDLKLLRLVLGNLVRGWLARLALNAADLRGGIEGSPRKPSEGQVPNRSGLAGRGVRPSGRS